MQELLNWARRLVYPAALCLLLWAGWQVLASPYISDSSGKIIAVYDGDSTVQDCTGRAALCIPRLSVSSFGQGGRSSPAPISPIAAARSLRFMTAIQRFKTAL